MQPGTQLGHYEIVSALGKGGMGEVWRARDQKLGREVAIKTLPEEFAKDEERLARFEREAKLLASLNHPNIATIHGLEEDSGTRFLVLELVEGDTLADRLKRGAIPVEESLKLALQIAEALEAAHEKGVVHRDLKPANVKVTPDGKVKVLDFGLAKALMGDGADANLSHSPTLSMAATQQGVILGTAAYMSPEQARGESADKRSDVWAFGVVLFEMLTGTGTFEGHTVSDVLAGVLARHPNWDSLPHNLHPRIRLLLERCLEKEAKNRYHDIADVRVDLETVLADPDGVIIQPVGEIVQAAPRSRLPWVAAIVLSIVVAGAAGWYIRPAEQRLVGRFRYELPADQSFRSGQISLAIAPDGRHFVYVTLDGLYLRSLDELEARLILEADDGLSYPFFSPDGQWIAFYSEGARLKKIPITGGPPVTISDVDVFQGGTWGEDDTIWFYQPAEGLMRVSANGGIPELALAGQFAVPRILPNGRAFLFFNQEGVAVQSLDSPEAKVLFPGQLPRYAASGHITYHLDGVLFAVGFDPDALEVTGGPVAILDDFQPPNYDLSSTGTLVYQPAGVVTPDRVLAFIGSGGGIEPIGVPPAEYLHPRLSPDGTTLAVGSLEDDGGVIWTYDLSDERQIQQLTFDGGNFRPIWTPDGERITFTSDRDGTASLYWQPADGSAEAERLTTAEQGTGHLPGSWSPDGQVLAFTVRTGPVDFEIWTLSVVDGEYQTEPLYDGEGRVYMSPEFSPDGKWLAYASGPLVTDQDIYVEPFPPTGRRERISQDGGYWMFWSRDGNTLFYRSVSNAAGNRLRSVDIDTEPDFSFTNEQVLPPEGFTVVAYNRDYDITPDGERILMVFPADRSVDASRNTVFNIVLNWFEELAERVPVP